MFYKYSTVGKASFAYMNNHVHSAPQPKKEESREERRTTHTKMHNNLNGLEKYSLIFGEQPQQLRKIYT